MITGKIEEQILYEDRDILVCHKPAGIAIQSAGIGTMDLESMLKNYLALKNGEVSRQTPGKQVYLAVIHRLDQPVEGVIVFGKTPRAAKELSSQIAGGKMEKVYLAVTFGTPPARDGILEDYLKKDGKTNTSFVTGANVPGSKKAKLSYRVLESVPDDLEGKDKYLIRIQLETGRHHQIRVQMAHGGMPLCGDRKYGVPGKANPGLGLCSAELSFIHPSSGKKMKFKTVPKGSAFQGFSLNKH